MDKISGILTRGHRPNSELSEASRAAIYSLYVAGYSHKAIAQKFNYYCNTISNTIKRF